MSISAIASFSSVESGLSSTVSKSNVASQAAINTAGDTGSSLASASNPADALTQDVIQLLKAVQSGNVSGAKNDLAKFKADLSAKSAATANSALAKDATSLEKDVSSGNTAGEKADVANIQQDLQIQAASGARTVPPSIQTVTPLDALAGKLTTSLTTGGTSTALKDLATFLVQQGHGTGNLVNTTA